MVADNGDRVCQAWGSDPAFLMSSTAPAQLATGACGKYQYRKESANRHCPHRALGRHHGPAGLTSTLLDCGSHRKCVLSTAGANYLMEAGFKCSSSYRRHKQSSLPLGIRAERDGKN